jgi:hypothetical protein
MAHDLGLEIGLPGPEKRPDLDRFSPSLAGRVI